MLKIAFVACTVAFATAGQWTENRPLTFDVLDVSTNSPAAGYGSAAANGVGEMIEKTTDGGHTWNMVANRTEFLALGCGSLNPSDAVVVGAIGKASYTNDGGKTWKTSIGFVPGGQSVSRGRLSTLYGVAGGRGVAVSRDHGFTWKHHTTKSANASRYSALVDDNTWFFTTGTWIQPTAQPTPFLGRGQAPDRHRVYRHINQRITYGYDHAKQRMTYHANLVFPSQPVIPQEQSMWGEIWKTNDGGSSFIRLLYSANKFYFNAIDCCSATLCYAVAEGDSDAGSNEPGARIFRMIDGKTFLQVFMAKGDGESLMGVKCLNTMEAYASGGTLVQGKFGGHFYYTTDGGKTWADNTVRAPVLFMDISNDGKVGLASGLTRLSEGVTFSYTG